MEKIVKGGGKMGKWISEVLYKFPCNKIFCLQTKDIPEKKRSGQKPSLNEKSPS